MSPTPRAGILLGAIALAVLALPVALVALAEVAVLVAMVVDIAIVRRKPLVAREVPSILSRGTPVRLRLTAQPAAGTIRLRQPVPPDLRLDPAQADSELDGQLVAIRRGRHVLPVPAARLAGPLGLGCWYRRAGEESDVVVYPDLPTARRLALAVRRGRFRLEGRARGPLGLGTEFESVREYQPDDDLRQVNWRATERMGRPMSNQYRVERDRDVLCLVDCGRLMAAPLEDRTRIDAAIDAAVAVAAVADELSDRVGAVAFDREVRRLVLPRRRGAQAVVSALYDLESVPVDSDYEAAFVKIGEQRRALVFVLTDLLDESAARPLLDALPMLSRRHVVVVATAADQDLERLLDEPPEDTIDVYRAAVALEVVGARTRAGRLLRQAGAEVIEAPAGGLGAACVRSYLRTKARARL